MHQGASLHFAPPPSPTIFLASLGVNAIWLTPIFDSSKANEDEKLRSTGYFANDYFSIDPNSGTDDARERRLLEYVRKVMRFRRDNPAMWRGRAEYDRYRKGDAEILAVIKTNETTRRRVAMIFAGQPSTTRAATSPSSSPYSPPRPNPDKSSLIRLNQKATRSLS